MAHERVERGSAPRVEVAGAVAFHAVNVPDLPDLAAQHVDHRGAGRERAPGPVKIVVRLCRLAVVEGADHAGQGRPERALGAPHVRVQGQAAVARAELLAVQHRVDAFQLVVDVSGVGVYRALMVRKLISSLSRQLWYSTAVASTVASFERLSNSSW